MSRPEKPVPDPESPLGQFATTLRNGRRALGISYAALADRTRFQSPVTLQRAASGKALPKLEVAQAFAHGCGLDVDEITHLWHSAHRGSTKTRWATATRPAASVPRPHLVEDVPGLCAALQELRQLNGAPSFRVMENRAQAANLKLSRSTAYRICAHRQPPASPDSLEAFLVVCQVAPRQRPEWHEAWRRAQRHASLDDQRAARREEARQLEAVAADNFGGRVVQDTAVRLLRKAGFEAMERYRGFERPWTVECAQCAATFRLRLSDVLMGRAACMECPRVNGQVQEAWAELLASRPEALDRGCQRALRAARVLPARMQHGHLDVPVFVPDPDTARALQVSSWHLALDVVLQRHIRRPFLLNVMLVQDYSFRNGQRQRRIAKAAGLVKGPVEPLSTAADEDSSQSHPVNGPQPTAHAIPGTTPARRTPAQPSFTGPATSNSGP